MRVGDSAVTNGFAGGENSAPPWACVCERKGVSVGAGGGGGVCLCLCVCCEEGRKRSCLRVYLCENLCV